MLCHLTAHALRGLTPFAGFAVAALAWRQLRAVFPAPLAAVLMPDHPHLIVDVDDPDVARLRLAAVLSGLARSAAYGAGGPTWAPVPPPALIPDAHHLRRQVRYVALNPCRERLVRDPLSWLWSTHRDVVGASAEPWVTADRLAAAVGARRRDFAVAHHAYVSGDPSTRVEGTPFPRPAPASPGSCGPRFLLETLRDAAAMSVREPAAAIARRGAARRIFVQLASAQGWHDTRLVGDACGLEPRAVRRLTRAPAPGLAAALLCLGDARLLAAAR